MIKLSEQQIIEQMTGRLVASYPRVDSAHVNRIVLEEYARFEGRPIRDFIPCSWSDTPRLRWPGLAQSIALRSRAGPDISVPEYVDDRYHRRRQ